VSSKTQTWKDVLTSALLELLEVLIWQPGIGEHISDFLNVVPWDQNELYEQIKGEKIQKRNPFLFHDSTTGSYKIVVPSYS